MSGLSLYAAICRGVSPCFSLASGEAPALMSASAMERPAPAAAQCRGVMPSLSALSAGAPQARSSSAAFSFPARRSGMVFLPVRFGPHGQNGDAVRVLEEEGPAVPVLFPFEAREDH